MDAAGIMDAAGRNTAVIAERNQQSQSLRLCRRISICGLVVPDGTGMEWGLRTSFHRELGDKRMG
jgi:hypothetical protein